IRRQGLAVMTQRAVIVGFEAQDVAEVDEVGGHGVAATHFHIEGPSLLEMPPRANQVTEVLRDEAELVAVGGASARVAGGRATGFGDGEQLSRFAEVTAREGDVAEGADGVRGRSMIAD